MKLILSAKTQKYLIPTTVNGISKLVLTVLFTPHSGRSSTAEATNSFPYFDKKWLRISVSSGISAHLGAVKIKVEIASSKSIGQFLSTNE